MDPINLHSITYKHTYRKMDNRRKKDYYCTLQYRIQLHGEGLKFLPTGKIVERLQERTQAQVTCSRGSENGNLALFAEYKWTAEKPSKIAAEAEVLQWTYDELMALANKEFYQGFVDLTNEQRLLIAEEYEPLLAEVLEYLEGMKEELAKRTTQLKENIEKNGGVGIARTLEWNTGDIYSYDTLVSEWARVHYDLRQSCLRAEDPLEALGFLVESRIDDLFWENTHNSTSILSNAFGYIGGKAKRSVLKTLRDMLRTLKRKSR